MPSVNKVAVIKLGKKNQINTDLFKTIFYKQLDNFYTTLNVKTIIEQICYTSKTIFLKGRFIFKLNHPDFKITPNLVSFTVSKEI